MKQCNHLTILLCLFVSLFFSLSVFSQSKPIELYFFYGQGCPYCAEAKPFLENLEKKYSQLKVRDFEVYKDEKNKELFSLLAQGYGKQIEGVPTIFIGEKVIVGYDEMISFQIEQAIQDCLDLKCTSPLEKVRIIKTQEEKDTKTERQKNSKIEEEKPAQSTTDLPAETSAKADQRNLLIELISAIILFLILGLIIFSIIKLIKKRKINF